MLYGSRAGRRASYDVDEDASGAMVGFNVHFHSSPAPRCGDVQLNAVDGGGDTLPTGWVSRDKRPRHPAAFT